MIELQWIEEGEGTSEHRYKCQTPEFVYSIFDCDENAYEIILNGDNDLQLWEIRNGLENAKALCEAHHQVIVKLKLEINYWKDKFQGLDDYIGGCLT